MPTMGENLEIYFRNKFEIKESIDIIQLLEAAMTVAVYKHPEQLLERRKGILEDLRNLKSKGINVIVDDDDDDSGEKTRKVIKTQKQRSEVVRSPPRKVILSPTRKVIPKGGKAAGENNIMAAARTNIITATTTSSDLKKLQDHVIKNIKEDVKDDDEIELKVAKSKKMLQERYGQIQIQRGKKRIQLLDLKDLPVAAARPTKFSCNVNRTRRIAC